MTATIQGLGFDKALVTLKRGGRAAREGWNGKGMWVTASCLNTNTVAAQNFWSEHNREYALGNGGTAEVPPCMTLRNAKGQIQMGWLPSQEDLFAEDWIIL